MRVDLTGEPPIHEQLLQEREMRAAATWLLATVALLFLLAGIERTTPAEVGALHLIDVAAFPAQYRARVRATCAALEQRGLEPREFYGRFIRQRDNTVLALWHQDSFRWRLTGCSKTLHMGNPTGKSRYVYFDQNGAVTKVLLQR